MTDDQVQGIYDRLDRIAGLLDERNALDRAMAESMMLITGGGSPPADVERPPGEFADYREAEDGWEVMVGGAWYPATAADVRDIDRRNSARRTRQRRH